MLATIRSYIDRLQIPYRLVEHGPTATSEESAAARGEPLEVGAKALVIKVDDVFRLFVLCADRQLDSAALKKHFQARKTRFATPEELLQLTGLVPGSVPPLGEPVLPLELYADEEVGRRTDRVAFNAGSLTTSLILASADWERAARPKRLPFIKT